MGGEDTWSEMLEVLKDIGGHLAESDRNANVKPIHREICYYCRRPIEDGVVKGGYTYCNLDHAMLHTLEKSGGNK